jgi:hypothetical protein
LFSKEDGRYSMVPQSQVLLTSDDWSYTYVVKVWCSSTLESLTPSLGVYVIV